MKTPSTRVTRWLEILSLYTYEVQHIPGSTNTAADASSRLEHQTEDRILNIHFEEPTSVRGHGRTVPEFDPPGCHGACPSGSVSRASPITALEIDAEPSWQLDYQADPVTNERFYNPVTGAILDATKWHAGRFWEDDRIVVPANRISEVIAQYHDNMVAGHWGVPRTTAIVTRRFSFPNIKQHVQQHVSTCPKCQIVKAFCGP